MPMKPVQTPTTKFDKTELKERLDPIEYQVTQENGTERPFTNKYYKNYDKGIYTCIVCEIELFNSDTKYESGSGWPSFYDVIEQELLIKKHDASGVGANLLRIVKNPDLIRTEVCCKNCGAHLGHVFKDGPPPTGMRYCVNSSSLNFREAEGDEADSATPREIIKHAATVEGCGADGFCTLKGRQEAEALKKKMAELKVSPEKEEAKP